MTYQMIQSVAVTGDIYQQFISYLLHESDTILYNGSVVKTKI